MSKAQIKLKLKWLIDHGGDCLGREGPEAPRMMCDGCPVKYQCSEGPGVESDETIMAKAKELLASLEMGEALGGRKEMVRGVHEEEAALREDRQQDHFEGQSEGQRAAQVHVSSLPALALD